MRTRRLVSLLIAVLAAIIWVLSTYANASNSWDPANLVVRIVAGAVTVAAAAEWLVLSYRESRHSGVNTDVAPGQPPVMRSAASRNVVDRVLSVFGPRRTRRSARPSSLGPRSSMRLHRC
jgi:hypothetical protein